MAEKIYLSAEQVMITASPGVSNDEFDPDDDGVGAKRNSFFDMEDGNGYTANPRFSGTIDLSLSPAAVDSVEAHGGKSLTGNPSPNCSSDVNTTFLF